ncbi:hypothetical protein [Thermoproteus tenax]|uniref:Uncharacterized protein n=1 Tax=Thermoproteus tenax (strain ATCC 35583 / DSM 2078 / JCM 9277 / NBRC 100435 / Kra 1) TaxID=768679 RepID=G4RMT6_THETK|nr:hypothetical protein [Thermoproteus tenax]CCC80880.1 hypothetical protein TTX_0201 [Thermoproteus tenax Kra 1]
MIEINAESNIALITLWAKPEEILQRLPPDVRNMVALASSLYSKDGVNYILADLASRRLRIDLVIVYGPDLTKSGEALIEALRGRCGEWARVPCEVLSQLGVEVLDLRDLYGDEAALAEEIRRRYKPRGPREKIEVALQPPRRTLGSPAPAGWGIVYDTSPRYLWIKVLDYVMTYGGWEAGLKAPIVAQLGVFGAPRREGPGDVRRTCGGAALASGETRPPCLGALVWRHGRYLNAAIYLGDYDVVNVWPRDLADAEEALRSAAAREGLEPGLLTYVMIAHISEESLDLAQGVVEREWRAAYSREVYDPRGNFVLAGDSISHYTPDGVLWRILSADRATLRREAAKLLPEHAFYLGEESAARSILRDRYEQEQWRANG